MRITSLSNDIFLTLDGDLYLNPETNSDLYISGPNSNELLESSVSKRLLSTSGEWDFAPSCGANLIDFVGLPNTRETAAFIETRVQLSLCGDGLLSTGDLDLDTAPLNNNSILMLMVMKSVERGTDSIINGWGYDLRDSKMVPRIINL